IPDNIECGDLTFRFTGGDNAKSEFSGNLPTFYNISIFISSATGSNFKSIRVHVYNGSVKYTNNFQINIYPSSNPETHIIQSPTIPIKLITGTYTTINDLVIETDDPEPTINTFAVNVTQPEEGGTIAVKNLDGTDIADLNKVPEGTEVKVVAQPAEGYETSQVFAIKSGVKEDITASEKFTVSADTEITATFTKKKYAVTIAATENGTVAVTTASGATITDNTDVEHGTELTITPAPSYGYRTTSVAVNGTALTAQQESYIHTVTGPTAIAATFDADDDNFATLSITEAQNGTLTVMSGESMTIHKSGDRVPVNTRLTITARPAPGYKLRAIIAGDDTKDFDNTDEGNADAITTKGRYIIAATFEKTPIHSVEWDTPNTAEGTMTVKNGDAAVTSGSEIENGTTLTVTLTAS
ncbi:MAG: hypothetical protein K2L63_06815, partial [Paramuribaculum sp.]|nr:hypothetical protein [Paramuribaculum sp.]